MSEVGYQSGRELLDGWRKGIESRIPPIRYPVGTGGLGRLEIGPGLISLLGGAPGLGKTALSMQLLFDALTLTTNLKALVCNVEMSPEILLDRQLARLADLDLNLIRQRTLRDEHNSRLEGGCSQLEALVDRLAFVRPPFTLANIAMSADVFGADLILIDYLQRIGTAGEHGDRRGAVDSIMSTLRIFADNGTAFIVIAAVSRSKDSKGRSSYSEGLNLASFRESSELEFGCDDAFILMPADLNEESPSRVVLKHLKSRHGEARDIYLNFDRPHQRFTPIEPSETTSQPSKRGSLRADMAGAWESNKPKTTRKEHQ